MSDFSYLGEVCVAISLIVIVLLPGRVGGGDIDTTRFLRGLRNKRRGR